MTRAASTAILAVALVAYFAVGVANLSLPGLQYDEAADAVPAVEVLRGLTPSSISHVNVFGRELPLMMLHHIGPTTIYTSMAGFALMGISVEALRLSQLIVGAIGLVLLWLLARAWFGATTAALAVLLCATAPPYIWWSRAGANFTVPLIPLALGMMLALTHWWRGSARSGIWIIVAAFLLGLGFTTKILFVWMLVPLALTTVLGPGLREVSHRAGATRVGVWVGAALALLAGLSPLIAHNFPDLPTLRHITSNAVETQLFGHNNLDFVGNLAFIVGDFARLIGGDTLHFGAPAGLPLGAVAAALALAFEVALLAKRGRPRSSSRAFLVACVVGVLPVSTISTSSIGATYLFILVPFAWLLIAVAILDAAKWLRSARSARVAGAFVVASSVALVGNHLVQNARVLRSFEITGGRNIWSNAIAELAQRLQRDFAGRPVFAMDWGFARNVEFLTQLDVRPREVFEYTPRPPPSFARMSYVLARTPGAVFLFHPERSAALKGRWDVFAREVASAHKTPVLVETFAERDGTPNSLLYVVEEVPRSFVISPALAGRDARFANGTTLLGGDATYGPTAREVAIVLQWRADADNLPDDTVLVHIVNEASGEVVAVADAQPFGGDYGLDRWQRGEVVVEPRWVTLPSNLKPGAYQVRIGAYDTRTKQRRAIDDPQNDAAGDSLRLKSFEVR